MPRGGTVKPGNRDFLVSRTYQELMDGVSIPQPHTPLPRTGKKIFGKDGLFTYFIAPGTEITEKNSFMFTHNMEVLQKRAGEIQSGGKETKEG